MGVVFAKTARGHDEIVRKSGELTPRQRRVLIFVDGRRTVEELRGMLLSDDLQHTLGHLEEAGYIELAAIAEAGGTTRPAPAALPPVGAFSELPLAADPDRLQKARNFMLNTLNAFVGTLGATSLIERIDRADGHAGLRALYDEWYHAIVMSRDGRREAEALRARLLAVI